jgi:hypothetical protein
MSSPETPIPALLPLVQAEAPTSLNIVDQIPEITVQKEDPKEVSLSN